MAQVEKVSHIGENPLVLSPNANKSVAKLLKENPYVAGVAVVSLRCYQNIQSHADTTSVRFLGRLPVWV